jgi:predicted aminopeptidase
MKRRTTLTLVVAISAISLLLLTPTGCYLSRAGWEEAKILRRRQPITELISNPAVDSVTRAKLRLVLDAREFAVDSLGLRARESFTTFSQLDSDTLVLVLSAAYRDKLEQHTWWFPIVGSVPYKGYFDFAQAHRDANELARRGFDVYLRPSAAFSTLGWFNDPLVSATLRADSLDLANTVIHELTHNTFYASGQAEFNESFANFVGARGAELLFRFRGNDRAAAEISDRWGDEKLLGAFWSRVYASLDSAYAAHPDDRAARLAARDSVYHRARVSLVFELGPQLRTVGPRYLERVRLDNAALLARRVYLRDLELFDAVYQREGKNLRASIRRIIELAKSREEDPFGAVREFAGNREPGTGNREPRTGNREPGADNREPGTDNREPGAGSR